jgi:hypothetical protein
MRILINENQFKRLITEASKVETLINKLGFSEEAAKELYELTGPLAVWFGNLIIKDIKYVSRNSGEDEIRNVLSKGNVTNFYRNRIIPVVDWIRVGLNGDVKPFMNLSLRELAEKSKEWHDSLEGGKGQINYVEENPIVRDYRKDGIGFYWVDLQTTDSSEECNRMGHCGRTSKGDTLYSLREVKKLNNKNTLNKSHVTAAISDDGIVYQMKGKKNSKPSEIFNPYIVDLILNDDKIKGFGIEYEGSKDFSILDLPDEEIKKIYDTKPELFNDRKSKRALKSIGIDVELPERNDITYIEIEPEDIHYYIDNDWVVSKYKTRDGRTNERYMSEVVLKGEDIYELYENYGDWESALKYYADETSISEIWDILKNYAEKQEVDLTDMSIEEAIENLDEDHEIRNSLSSSENDASLDSVVEHYQNLIRDALSEYGEITKFDYTGVQIKVSISQIANDMGYDNDSLDEIYDRCEDDVYCVYNDLMVNYYDKPRLSLDSRWTPDVDGDNFNSILQDRLSDIRI